MTSRTPIDEFKRSLGAATKALSGEAEMEVRVAANENTLLNVTLAESWIREANSK
jgi:hypothetical protein